MKTRILFAGLAIMATTTLISAQTANKPASVASDKVSDKCTAWVDNNNNGVCDNYENRQTTARRGDGKGAGRCNGMGEGRHDGQGRGRNFTDADKNGVCDHHETQTKK